MAAPTPSRRMSADTVGLAAAISMIAVVGTAIGLIVPLLSFGLSGMGASAGLVGLNGAVGAVAAIVAAPLTPALARRFGMRGASLLALGLGAAAVAGFFLLQTVPAWFALRFPLNVALTILFVISEFWIVSAAPDDRRGLVMGIYATVLSIGFALGPAVLAATGAAGVLPYLAGVALFAIAALPVVLVSDGAAPKLGVPSSLSLLQVMRAAPSATLAGLMFGAVETGTMAFMPLYGLTVGLGVVGAAALLSAVGLGNVLIQIPLGLVSDRMDRRTLLLLIAGFGAAGAAVVPLVSHSPAALFLLLFAWGGSVAGLYTVGLAHLGARFTGPELAKANAAFVFSYSLGMLVGPPAIGLGMDAYPPHGALFVIAAILGAYAVFVLLRIRAAPRLP